MSNACVKFEERSLNQKLSRWQRNCDEAADDAAADLYVGVEGVAIFITE